MTLFHPILIYAYLALPVIALGWSLYRSRQERSFRPLAQYIIHCAGAIVIAVTGCLIFAKVTETYVPASQVALTSYLLIGVLAVLWGLSWLLRQLFDRLLVVHRSQQTAKPRGQAWVARAAVAILLRSAVLFGIGLPYLMAIGLVYRPRGVGAVGVSQALPGAAAQPIEFAATDGQRISGWWIPARRASATDPVDPDWGKKTVIVCHGWGATRGDHLSLARELWPHGYNVLAFDFRAHGQSGGQLVTFGDRERHDVLGAVRWLRQNQPDGARRIVGIGMTTGAAALVAAAADDSEEGHAIDAVALFGPFDEFASVARDTLQAYSSPPVRWLLERVGLPLAGLHAGSDLSTFAPAEYVDRIAPRPVLLVHARADGLITMDAGRRLFARASQPKYRLWVGEPDLEGRLVIRRTTGNATTTQPATYDGVPAQHHNLMYDDASMRAVRMWFEVARSAV